MGLGFSETFNPALDLAVAFAFAFALGSGSCGVSGGRGRKAVSWIHRSSAMYASAVSQQENAMIAEVRTTIRAIVKSNLIVIVKQSD